MPSTGTGLYLSPTSADTGDLQSLHCVEYTMAASVDVDVGSAVLEYLSTISQN
jgi:hypothetical protein